MATARVIRMTSLGAEGLRQAIEDGIGNADTIELAKRVMDENDALKKENSALRGRLRKAMEELEIIRGTTQRLQAGLAEGYRLAFDGEAQVRQTKAWRRAMLVMAGCIGGVIVMLATVLAMI